MVVVVMGVIGLVGFFVDYSLWDSLLGSFVLYEGYVLVGVRI